MFIGFNFICLYVYYCSFRAVYRPYNGRLRRGPSLMVVAARKTQEPCKEGSRRTQQPVALILHFACIERFFRRTLDVRAACIECFGWGQSKQLVRVARQSRVAASLKMLPAGFLGSKVAPGRRYNPNHGVAVYGLITKTINCGPGGCSEARDSRHRSFTPGTSLL